MKGSTNFSWARPSVEVEELLSRSTGSSTGHTMIAITIEQLHCMAQCTVRPAQVRANQSGATQRNERCGKGCAHAAPTEAERPKQIKKAAM